MFNIEDKVVAITGAGGHLCGTMAKGFARAGCSVAVIDIRLDKAKEIAEQIRSEGFENVIAIEANATIKSDHEKALGLIIAKFGRVDIFINGAGINGPTPFLDITEEEWDAVMDSQIKSTFFGCQVFGNHMLFHGKGVIINVSSASADPPLSKAFTYSAAKASILNLTKNVAREWATKGVRVNAIRPGFFPTEWNRKNFITAEREAAILGHTPMARFGEPEELLGAILWLASDAAGFVTGAEIAVDGGFSCMTI